MESANNTRNNISTTSLSKSQKFKGALKHAADKLRIACFRKHQEDAIINFTNGHDVFISLPTNYGKSKIYQGVPLCQDYMRSNSQAIALVVSPITAIIEQQVQEMNSKSIPALHLRCDFNWSYESAAIKLGKYSILFGSPETFANSATKDLLASSEVRTNICGIFVDESHCIEQW
jgi:ATP-dependent DNA helicase RecQ